jgi:hypothetical protein
MCCAWRSGGRWHASERQLAWLGCSAGSQHQCMVRTTPRRARRGKRPGGPGSVRFGSVHNVFLFFI